MCSIIKNNRIRFQCNKVYLVLYFFSFVLFFFVSQCSPLRGDDMEFIGHRFLSVNDVFTFSLYYGNGRLLGNFIGVSIVYSKILTSIIKALVISSIIILLPKVLEIKNTPTIFVSFIMITACSAVMFGEVFISVCAFSNYIIPIWLTLLIIYFFKFRIESKHLVRNVFFAIIIFVLGIASQLFAEHTTIINIIISLIVFIYAFKIKQKLCIAIIYFSSTVLGSIFMYAIPKVFYMSKNRVEGYRSVNLNSIPSMLSSINETFQQFTKWMFNSYSLIILCCIIVFLTVLYKKEKLRKPLFIIFMFSNALIFTYYFCRSLFLDVESYGVIKIIREFFDYSFVIAFIVLLFCCFYISINVKILSVETIIFLLFVLSLLPLFIVSPVRSRCFFQAYVFWIAFMLLWIDRGFSKKSNIILLPSNIVCSGVVISLSISIILTSASLHWLDNIRRNHIIQEMKHGARTIEVFTIKSDYESSDNKDFYGKQYYYNTWNDIDFKTIGQNEWIDKYR